MNDDDSLRYYGELLASRPSLANALCVTAVADPDADSVAARFGTEPGTATSRSLLEAESAPGVLVVGTRGWTIMTEPNGFHGSLPKVLRAVSRGSRAFSVYWSVDDDSSFGFAEDGRLVAGFDPIAPGSRFGREPTSLDERLGDLPFGGPGWKAAGLAALERLSGIRLGEHWLTAPHPFLKVRPIGTELVPEGFAGDPALSDPELQGILACPRPGKLPLITRLIAELVVVHTGLGDQPVVAGALSALRGPREERAAHAARLERERKSAGQDPVRANVLRALLGAFDDDPVEAARKAHWAAGYVISRDRAAQLRLEVLDRCRRAASFAD